MSLITYTVLHYEDEPQTVDWLQESIYLALCGLYPSLDNCDEEEVVSRDEATRTYTFTMPPATDNRGLSVVYRICETHDGFADAIQQVPDPDNTVIILDLMGQGECALELFGVNCYEKIPAAVRVEKRFFLSGYADSIPDDIVEEIGLDHVFRKPVNIPSFAASILTALSLPNGS